MSQHPHDEFDDIPPYQSGEAGKHRAPGPTGAGAGRSGGLKWIALLAAVVLVVGLFSWLVFGDDDAETTAGEGEDGVTEEQEPAEGQDGDAEEGGEAEEGEGDAGDGDGEAQNGEQDAADEDGEVDMSTPVQIYNHNGPEGTAANAQSQIEQQGYNVTALNNWDAPGASRPPRSSTTLPARRSSPSSWPLTWGSTPSRRAAASPPSPSWWVRSTVRASDSRPLLVDSPPRSCTPP